MSSNEEARKPRYWAHMSSGLSVNRYDEMSLCDPGTRVCMCVRKDGSICGPTKPVDMASRILTHQKLQSSTHVFARDGAFILRFCIQGRIGHSLIVQPQRCTFQYINQLYSIKNHQSDRQWLQLPKVSVNSRYLRQNQEDRLFSRS